MILLSGNRIEMSKSGYRGVSKCGSSKSRFIRIALASLLSDSYVTMILPENTELSRDELSALNALKSFHCDICESDGRITIDSKKVKSLNKEEIIDVNCGESATLFRFITIISCLFENDFCFFVEGSLIKRPFNELINVISQLGVSFSFSNGKYEKKGTADFSKILDMNVSSENTSQIIGGLSFLLSFGDFEGNLKIGKNPVSLSYIEMTIDVLKSFGKNISLNIQEGVIEFLKKTVHSVENEYHVHEDESKKAIFECANLLGNCDIYLKRDVDKLQPDSGFLHIAKEIINGKNEISLRDTPDLIFLLSLVASKCSFPVTFTNCERLRGKESDRFTSCVEMLRALGCRVELGKNFFTVFGNGEIHGCTIDAKNDHRILFAAWVASIITEEKITIINGIGAEKKSFPKFFDIVRELEVQ